MRLFLIGILIIVSVTVNEGSFLSKTKFLSSFCSKNGFKSVSIQRGKNVSNDDVKLLADELVEAHIRISKLKMKNLEGETILYIAAGPTEKAVEELNIHLKLYPPNGVLFISTADDTDSSETIKSIVPSVSVKSFFYWIAGERMAYKILKYKLKKKPIVMDVSFNRDDTIRTKFDNFRGAHLHTIMLTWFPFIMIDYTTKSQTCSGVGKDVTDIVAEVLNFTYTCTGEKKKEWGLFPSKNKTYNVGVMGKLGTGESDFGVPIFYWTVERHHSFEFVKGINSVQAGVYYMDNKSLDLGLLLLPFKMESWFIIAVIFVVALLLYKCGSLFGNKYSESTSYKILLTSIAYMFLIINAYYGGALTMFFTTEISVPFQSLIDVIYNPEWELRFINSNVVGFLTQLKSNNEKVLEHNRIIRQNPHKYEYPTVIDGLKNAKKEYVVIVVDTLGLETTFANSKELKSEYGNYYMIDKKSMEYHFIFARNSPLIQSFQPVCKHLFERGIFYRDIANRKSFAKDSERNTSFIIPNLRQLSAAFLLLLAAAVVSFICLVIEKRYEKPSSKSRKKVFVSPSEAKLKIHRLKVRF